MNPLDDMLLGPVEGVVFDVDDTVTRDGRLEVVALDALYRLRVMGLRTIALTGRPLGWADMIATTWPVDLAIGENGAGWTWREGRALREGYFDPEAVRDEQRVRLEAVRALVRERFPRIRESYDTRARRCDIAFDIGESVDISPSEICALRECIESMGMQTALSSVHLHAIAGEWDKAKGCVRAFESMWELDPDEVRSRYVFIGDSGNDAPAFAYFENTIGVANVREHLDALPVAPRWVTSLDRGRGFEQAVTAILSNLTRFARWPEPRSRS